MQEAGVTVGEMVQLPTGLVFNFADNDDNYFAVMGQVNKTAWHQNQSRFRCQAVFIKVESFINFTKICNFHENIAYDNAVNRIGGGKRYA